MTRMSLNTFARHGVFEDRFMVQRPRRSLDPLLAAHPASGKGVPAAVREALHDAMEVATANVVMMNGRKRQWLKSVSAGAFATLSGNRMRRGLHG